MQIYISNRQLKRIALLLSVVLVLSITAVPTMSYIVTQTASILNTFISGLAPEGNLIIRKSVEHPFGENYTLPEELQFMFWVELGADYAGETVETTLGPKKADGNGAFSLTVKPGNSVTVQGITAGTEVKVTEIQLTPGFQVKDGAVIQSVTIAARENAVVSFVNTYSPTTAPVNLTVGGLKNLVGRDWQEGDTFTFQLDYRYADDQGAQWSALGTQNVVFDSTNPEFNRFDFTELIQGMTFDRTGVYAFRVSEVAGSIGGITYDDAISYFDVLVGDMDMDGALEIRNVTGSSNTEITKDEISNVYNVAVSFYNSYAPAGSAEVTIPIVKELEDRSGQNKSPAGFTFELYDAEGQLLKTSEATSAAGESSIKLVYGAESAGQTYVYTLKEAVGTEATSGLIYDQTEYLLHVSVIDNLDGTVSAITDIAEVTFHNVYDPWDVALNINGTKSLTGRSLREGEFSFELYETGADFAADQQLIFTAVNSIDGSFAFDALNYSCVGTYYYVVQEDASAQLAGISYDETKYFVTVTVTDENGQLVAQKTVTDVYGNPAAVAFNNSYHPMGVFLPLGGKKILEGAAMTEGIFSFKLYEADEHFNARGEAVQSVSNDYSGTFRFHDLFFSTTGDYYYIVVEDASQPIEGVSYDATVYCLSISVTDDGNGQLAAAMTLSDLEGGQANEIVFVNIFTPEEDPTDPNEPTDPTDPSDPGRVPTTDDLDTIPVLATIGTVSLVLLLAMLMYVYWDKRFVL